MATPAATRDKYRSYLSEEEINNTKWNFGPPNYDDVNKLFEEGRTNIWPVGSLEEKVQRLVKTWEMELLHKADPDEYKTVDAEKFKFGVNGRKFFTLAEIINIGGGYNAFLQTSLPTSLRLYNSEEETAGSSQTLFKTTFPRGFVIEILQVYSGPPVIVYKFRHWGFMEGAFKGHAPTGEKVEFFGMAIFELDEHSKIVKVEFFYDRGELLAGFYTANGNCGVQAKDFHNSSSYKDDLILLTRIRYFVDPGYPYEEALSKNRTDLTMYLYNKQFSMTKGGLILQKPDSTPLQYAATASFLSKLYSDYLELLRRTSGSCNTDNFTLEMLRLRGFSMSQVDYILGNNLMKMSYM
ncbi:unnamed protein product [Fraxinus pennsylvanica]|uniref:cellulase n=1 Tax=Fraxinus pennsylvanica TaxID=56036 RepID=A0AAD1ZZ21_9LAMI|nr:unnamed protein product [Fraxinus pennsylvanica]